MKLHRDLEIGQKAAWFMLMRLREGWNESGINFGGPVEAEIGNWILLHKCHKFFHLLLAND